MDECAVRTEEIEILLGSPLNDPDLVKHAESVLKKHASSRSGADNPVIDSLPLTCYFDAVHYGDHNPDVAAAGLHPYLHFLQHGVIEGRNPHPLIDLAFIRSKLPRSEQAPMTVQALADALDKNQIRPHRYFDSDFYLSANPDVRDCGIAALRHYIRHGAAEGRLPHPQYDHERYVAAIADAPRGYYDSFIHCIAHQPAAGGLPGIGDGPENAASLPATGPRAGAGSLPRAGGMPAGVQGWLDRAVDGVAYGWAHDAQQPFKRLEVEIVEGRRIVGRGMAMLHRGDLQESGHGDGRCAFAIRLSNTLRDGRSHTLTARVADLVATALNGEQTYGAPAASPVFDMLPSLETVQLCEAWSEGWADREQAREFVSTMERCNLLLETDQGRQGLDGLEAIAQHHGAFELVHVKIGEAHLALNAPELALESYERALEGNELADWALLGVGNCYRLLGRWDQAKGCYMRGLSSSPDRAPHGARMRELEDRVRTLSARRFLTEGDTQSALHALVPQLAARPEDPRLKDLVCEVLDVEWERAGGGQPLQLDAEMTRARRSVALLKTVLDHHAEPAGART